MEVREQTLVEWFEPKERPTGYYDGKQILVIKKSDADRADGVCITAKPYVMVWRPELGFPEDTYRWAPIPDFIKNREVVLNKSFGRFCISDRCREEMGLTTDRSAWNYVPDLEIRERYRWSIALVAAVKKLGFLANGPGADLVVVEIPASHKREDIIICDRNGYETIAFAEEGC